MPKHITREQKARLEDYFGFDKYSSYMEKTNGHSYVDGETYDRFSTYAQFNEGLFGNQLSNKMKLLIEKIFGLENRLIHSEKIPSAEIDYSLVNKKWFEQRKKAEKFLQESNIIKHYNPLIESISGGGSSL